MLNYNELLDTNNIKEEFEKAFLILKTISPCVGIFGSGSLDKTSKYYNLAYKLSKSLAQNNISIITGGGDGIMEAANKGANETKANSIGLCIKLKDYEEKKNQYIHPNFNISFNHFFSRKSVFFRYARAIVCFPGGYGTLDELSETLLLIRAKKIPEIPFYLIGVDFYQDLIKWMRDKLIDHVPKKYLDILKVTDNIDKVSESIINHIKSPLNPK